jgi:hypothetical protein
MPQNISRWKEEFDKKFGRDIDILTMHTIKTNEIKSFISQTLQALTTEMIEGVGKKVASGTFESGPDFDEGYNQAKSEVREALKSIIEKWGL